MKHAVVVGIGEILWDLLPDGKQLGGAPANFACHAMALGARSYIVSAVGDDPLGREILGQLQRLGIDTAFVAIDRRHPTGTVTVQMEEGGVPSYTIHEGVAWDQIAFADNARALASRADALCFGTLAQRSETSRQSILRFLETAPPACLRIYDVNLRQNYFNRTIVEESLRRCNVLKLNKQELPQVAELLLLSGSESEILRSVIDTFALKLIALTMGAEGSRLIGLQEDSIMGASQVPVADTVGAGDAFTAALAVGLLEGLPLRAIHENSTQLAGFVCTRQGAVPAMEALREFIDTLSGGRTA